MPIDDVINTELIDRFLYHKPDDTMTKQIEQIRQQTLSLAKLLAELCPDGRERSIAFTKMEECSMWAVKSIVRKAPLA
jgi:hypothetical protein